MEIQLQLSRPNEIPGNWVSFTAYKHGAETGVMLSIQDDHGNCLQSSFIPSHKWESIAPILGVNTIPYAMSADMVFSKD